MSGSRAGVVGSRLFSVYRLGGCFPVTSDLALHPGWQMISVTVLSLLFLLGVYSYLQLARAFLSTYSEAGSFLNFFALQTSMLLAIPATLHLVLARTHSLARMLRDLRDVDQSLGPLDCKSSLDHITILFLTVPHGINMVFNSRSYITPPVFGLFPAYMFLHCLRFVEDCSLGLALSCLLLVARRFRLITEKMWQLNTGLKVNRLTEYRNMHCQLEHVKQRMNWVFDPILLVNIVNLFTYVVIFSLYVLHALVRNENWELHRLAGHVYGVMQSVAKIALLVCVSHYTSQQSMSAMDPLLELSNRTRTLRGPLRKELRLFSEQLLHTSSITACGLFTLDPSLFVTMGGAVSTYLVLFLQFGADARPGEKTSTPLHT